MLNISRRSNTYTSDSILITGSARSGTTLVGSLVHSMENVEYSFEPATLISLISVINKFPKKYWKYLYDTYMYEEILLNSSAGRYINCNRVDDSSIYKVKSLEEIEERVNNVLSRESIQSRIEKSIIAVKIPNIVYKIPALKAYYPDIKVVIVLRDAVDTLNSLLNKKWFAPEIPRSEVLWPYHDDLDHNIPFWVKKKDFIEWIGMNEIDRAAYYYIRQSENIDAIPDRLEIKYSELMKDPLRQTEELSNSLGLNFGKKTNEIIGQVARKEHNRDYKILKKIREDYREKVIYYSSLCE